MAHFQGAVEVNGWDDFLKIQFLSLLFSGHAREVYSGLVSAACSNCSKLIVIDLTEEPSDLKRV